LPWDEVPQNILEPYGFEDAGDLFLSGEAPTYAVCAKPAKLAREEPWCYCPGAVPGWAYCQRTAVNCSEVGGDIFESDSVEAASCAHRYNLCGSWTLPCRRSVLAENNSMFYKERNQFLGDGTFNKIYSHAMTKSDCEKDRFFVELSTSGAWRHEAASKWSNDTSLISTEVSQAWLQIVREENCYPTSYYDKSGAPPMCFNTSHILEDLCPCNNWKFIEKDGSFVKRNVILFCRPAEQCPLLLNLVIRKPSFQHYNASTKAACFYKPEADQIDGWGQGLLAFKPQLEACTKKDKEADCFESFVTGFAAAVSVQLLLLRLI
jgi:hypothetical protein